MLYDTMDESIIVRAINQNWFVLDYYHNTQSNGFSSKSKLPTTWIKSNKKKTLRKAAPRVSINWMASCDKSANFRPNARLASLIPDRAPLCMRAWEAIEKVLYPFFPLHCRYLELKCKTMCRRSKKKRRRWNHHQLNYSPRPYISSGKLNTVNSLGA